MTEENNIKRKLGFWGILFTLLYIFLEISFNIGLVDFVNSKNTEIDRFEQLETLGRILSSLGLSIFLINIFKSRKIFINLGLLIVFSFSLYFTQNYVFNKIIDNMSDESKLQAYSLGVYRNLYINGEIKEEESRIFSDDSNIYNEVVNSMIGVVLLNPELNKNVKNYVSDFFEISLNIPKEDLNDIYEKVNSFQNNSQSEELWKFYTIENKRFNNYNGFFKKEYEKRFIETLGISPNLSKSDFMLYIQSQQKDVYKIENIAIVPENEEIGLKALLLKDIPNYLNKEEWVSYVQSYIEKGIEGIKLSPENINNLPHSRAVISSVVIVPIAIVLSLLSIILNLCLLFGLIHRFIVFTIVLIVGGLSVFHLFAMNYYNLPVWANSIVHLEKYNIIIFEKYRNIIHDKFINDENPNINNIIKIEKPTMPDIQSNYAQLQIKFEEFNKSTAEFEADNNKHRNDLKIENEKLNEKGYYGEVDKTNPYQ